MKRNRRLKKADVASIAQAIYELMQIKNLADTLGAPQSPKIMSLIQEATQLFEEMSSLGAPQDAVQPSIMEPVMSRLWWKGALRVDEEGNFIVDDTEEADWAKDLGNQMDEAEDKQVAPEDQTESNLFSPGQIVTLYSERGEIIARNVEIIGDSRVEKSDTPGLNRRLWHVRLPSGTTTFAPENMIGESEDPLEDLWKNSWWNGHK